MARPPADVLEHIDAQLEILGLASEGEHPLVARANRHQSLSDKHPLACREQMLRACERIRAHSFELCFDRIEGRDGDPGTIHWTLRGRASSPPGFSELLEEVKRNLHAEHVDDRPGHTPHVTLNYFAMLPLVPAVQPLAPVVWLVDRIELVVAGGHPYRYDTLMSWPLLPQRQAALF